MISPEIVYREQLQPNASTTATNTTNFGNSKSISSPPTKASPTSSTLHNPPTSSPPTYSAKNGSTTTPRVSTSFYAPFNAFFSYPETHTAKSKLDSLESKFNRVNSTVSIQHRINLLRSFITRRMGDATSISQHVLDMKAAARELEMAGVNVPDEMQAVVLINSLPESWDTWHVR